MTTAGVVTEFPISTSGNELYNITAGPDDALWFTESNAIGRITTDGIITEFSIPTGNSFPYGITAGPEGSVWFTEVNANKIGRITTVVPRLAPHPIPNDHPQPRVVPFR